MDDRQNITFQKLTPIDNADISVYEDAIEFSLKNDDITNVALSGPYSAGKSSIIETYKKKHPDKKFVHISLAHFERFLKIRLIYNFRLSLQIDFLLPAPN